MKQTTEFIALLGYEQIFSTLHASSGYWKDDIVQENQDKAAFTIHHGLFDFTHQPLWIKERVKDVSLRNCCCAYISQIGACFYVFIQYCHNFQPPNRHTYCQCPTGSDAIIRRRRDIDLQELLGWYKKSRLPRSCSSPYGALKFWTEIWTA